MTPKPSSTLGGCELLVRCGLQSEFCTPHGVSWTRLKEQTVDPAQESLQVLWGEGVKCEDAKQRCSRRQESVTEAGQGCRLADVTHAERFLPAERTCATGTVSCSGQP